MKTIVKKSIKSLMAVAVAFVGLNTAASAGEVLKRDTVYAIENMDAAPFPLGVFEVNSDGTLARQDTVSVPTGAYSAVGLAVSTKNKLLFVSHEFSATLDVIDGETGAAKPGLTIPGTSNIAGIVVSESRNRLYAVDRGNPHIYVYTMNSDGTVTRVLSEEFDAAYGVWGIDVWGDKLYCTHGYNEYNKVTVYDLDSKVKDQEYTTIQAMNMAIAVDGIDSSNILFYTTWTTQSTSSNTVTQFNTNTGEEKFIVLGKDGRGLSVNPALGVVYAVAGDSYDTTATELRTYGKSQFTTSASNSPAPLGSEDLSGNPTDVVAVGITFDPDLTIEIIDPADKNVKMCNDVTFEINITNPSSDQALIVDDMEDNYDAAVMRFVSSSVTPTDSTDDGNITWENLSQRIELDSVWTFTKTFYAYEGATPTFETLKVTSAALEDGTPVEIDNTIYFDIEYSETPCIIEVAFDVHPKSCPNPITLKSGGVTPMAIMGTEDLNVYDIDASTLQITIDGEVITPVKYSYEDVWEPYTGAQDEEADRDQCSAYECVLDVNGECVDNPGDEIMDLTFKFKTKDLRGLDEGVHYLTIEGEMNDGTPITGKDVIWVK